MCGIAGLISKNNFEKPISDIIADMVSPLKHRGPDQLGSWHDDDCALGHTRLSIIDLDSGDQPIIADNGMVIIFNGEIYNYKEIRQELKGKEVNFKTQSDTEVLLQAYTNWGPDCLHKLNGMFAFAIWDPKKRQLFIARDRLGKKPLIFYHHNNCFAFASEIKSFAAAGFFKNKLTIDPRSLSDYLSLGYILTPKSIFRELSKLPAANYAIYSPDTDELKKVQYWNLADYYLADKKPFNKRTENDFLELLDNAVSIRLRSDVPLGSLLSGGVDSSSIISSMVRQSTSPVHAYCVGFQNDSFDESGYAKLVSNHLGIDLEIFNHSDLNDADISKLVWHGDEPFADTSIIPTFNLSQQTRKRVKVALSGDGADEIFAGYSTYTADRLFTYYSKFPAPLQNGLINLADLLFKPSYNKVSFDYKLKQFLQSKGMDRNRAHYWWRNVFSESEKQRIMAPELVEACEGYDPFDTFQNYFDQVGDARFLDQTLYVDTKTWLQDDILVKVDRMSMANSLEIRSPFLDHRLVEFAATLPESAKRKWRDQKIILKNTMSSFLPRKVLTRKKRGFNSPMPENGTKRINSSGFEHLFDDAFSLDSSSEDITFKSFTLDVINVWLKMYQNYLDSGQWKALKDEQ